MLRKRWAQIVLLRKLSILLLLPVALSALLGACQPDSGTSMPTAQTEGSDSMIEQESNTGPDADTKSDSESAHEGSGINTDESGGDPALQRKPEFEDVVTVRSPEPVVRPQSIDELVNVDVEHSCGEWDAMAFEFELSGIEPSGISIDDSNLQYHPTFEDACTDLDPPVFNDGTTDFPCNPFIHKSEFAPSPMWNEPAGSLRLRWTSGGHNPSGVAPGIVQSGEVAHFGYSPKYTAIYANSAQMSSQVPVPHWMTARYYPINALEPSTEQALGCQTAPISLSLTNQGEYTGTMTAQIGAQARIPVDVTVWTFEREVGLGELVATSRLFESRSTHQEELVIVPREASLMTFPVDQDQRSVVIRAIWEPDQERVRRPSQQPRMTSYHGFNLVWRSEEVGIGATIEVPSNR